MEIAAPAMAVGARLRHHQQQRIHRRIVPAVGEQFDRVARAIGPDIVAVRAQYRVAAQQWFGLDQSAAGFEQRGALVGRFDGEGPIACFEMRLQRIR